ncbi:BTB/POZ domain-containing protein [Colletotrichum higginsianum IMI 349063]|uniref:BTB/POZ domain-containing protein n=1 Tax=Colletotrichum higginsianum (strain IMI 349063) TaxID=759273 RepID=A0A1B7Y0W3_COLHI|nr:BTB/POZ domain-containing protein [Colletotrichum higginsianum IMI 349063]OBR05623.1 BTB/POZ domain-containing protein [Colletotrichum higginsianum IMI 349063]
MDDVRTTSVFKALSSFFMSENFSDMKITCGGGVYSAHRVVVCGQSSFFDKALSGTFKEAATATVDLPEDDPDILEKFLEYLYTGNYDDKVVLKLNTPANVALMNHEEVMEKLSHPPGVLLPVRPLKGTRNLESKPGERGIKSSRSTLDSDDDPDDSNYQASDHGRQPPGPEDRVKTENEEEEEEEDGLPVEIEQDYNPTRAVVDGDPATDRNVFIRDQAAVRNDLFLHLRVYVMADKFAVPALKLLARDRFYRAAELAWDVADEFPDVVDELYTNTPDTDVDMRGIVCRLVGNNVFDDRVRERLEPVMRKHGDFAVGVLKHVIAESKERW